MKYSWTIVLGVALAPALPALAILPPQDGNLFVTEEYSGNVFEHNGVTGAYYQTYAVVPPAVGLMAIHTGGTLGNVLVGSTIGGVREYDRTTGAFVKTYNAGGGWQWAGVWKANGNVLIGDWATNDVREYDSVTGNFLSVFAPGVAGPADMLFGPSGNLYVCDYLGGGVREFDGVTGAPINSWAPGVIRPNDIVFMPDGRRIVTSMSDNLAHVFDSSWTQIATFGGTGWARPHGIDISPTDGKIYVIDGVTQAVHVFDPTTYAELNANFLTTAVKPVDIEFRRPIPAPGAVAVLFGLAAIPTRRRRAAI